MITGATSVRTMETTRASRGRKPSIAAIAAALPTGGASAATRMASSVAGSSCAIVSSP